MEGWMNLYSRVLWGPQNNLAVFEIAGFLGSSSSPKKSPSNAAGAL